MNHCPAESIAWDALFRRIFVLDGACERRAWAVWDRKRRARRKR